MAKCPARAITYDRDTKEENFSKYTVKIDSSKCTNCKLCLSKGFCPIGAIIEK
jgi:formate hydrogenlyase subunit 6/NADH:ubiquinone oxidoreductase subunit I